MRYARISTVALFFYCLAYLLIQGTGILGTAPAPLKPIFFMPLFLAGATLLGICSAVLAFSRRESAAKRQWLPGAGIILMVAGLWTSYLTRVDLELVLTETQSDTVNSESAANHSGYAGRLARIPEIYLKLISLAPVLSPERKELLKLSAEYVLLTDDGKEPQKLKKDSSSIPAFRSGYLVSFKDFGYSPRYVLKSGDGGMLDSAFVFLNLFPPDTEDYFRLMSPHTYYVRYFPEGKGDMKEPFFNLRISRNKDLVLNRAVKLEEEVKFDGTIFSFAEVKKWTKFRVVRDPGLLLWPAGIICFAAGLLVAWKSRGAGAASICSPPYDGSTPRQED